MTNTNTYEFMFVLRPDFNQEQINKQMHKYRDLLKDLGAEKISMEVWGKRRLAYPIKKFTEGVYILTYYTGDGSQVNLVERDMRLGEDVLRFLTIKHNDNFEFEEKEIPDVQSIPVSSPQSQLILKDDIKPEVVEENTVSAETEVKEEETETPAVEVETEANSEAETVENTDAVINTAEDEVLVEV